MAQHPNPAGWFEIHVADMARAQAFYQAVFKRNLHTMPAPEAGMDMMVFEGDPQGLGCMGALVKHPMKSPSTEGVLVYFSCENCNEVCARALAHGGKVYKPTTSVGPNGFIAIIGDSEGNALGVHALA
jgi:hypothetical protein